MIKSVTTSKSKDSRKNITTMGCQVEIEGSKHEILHEMLGILTAFEKDCPEILLMAIRLHMEGAKNDN